MAASQLNNVPFHCQTLPGLSRAARPSGHFAEGMKCPEALLLAARGALEGLW